MAAEPALVVLDIPLLFEGRKSGTGSAALIPFDTTVLVWVPVELQVERQMERDGCDEDEARRRIAAQMPIDEKRAPMTASLGVLGMTAGLTSYFGIREVGQVKQGDTVVVSCKDVPKPTAVRYAYTMNPDGCNLYNKAGLPASPFTTDGLWK